jgi:hypothetical protein
VVCSFEFLIPFTLGGHNFLNHILFLTIFDVSYAPIEGVQVLLGHQKQQNLLLGFCLP